MFDIFPFFYPAFLITMENVWQIIIIIIIQGVSLSWSLTFAVKVEFAFENLFCLSHCKTYWTMTMGNVGVKVGLLGTSSSMVILTFFFLM
jgi:hypothetical protein